MTNTWVHGVEVNFCDASSVLGSACLEDPLLAKKVSPSDELAADCGNDQRDGTVTSYFPMSLGDDVSQTEKHATWEPDCDGVSDEGSYPSVAYSGSTDTDTGPLAGSKLMPCGGGLNGVDKSPYGLELQQDAGGEFFDTEESPIWARPSQSQCSPSISPQKNVRISEGSANVLKQRPPTGLPRDPSRSISQEMEPHCADLVASLNLSRSEESACETGVSNLKKQLGSGKVVSVADANGTSSSYASFLQPNEQAIKSCRRRETDAAFRDLEAGLEIGNHLLNRERRKLHERGFYDKDLVADLLTSGSLLNHTSGNELGKILLSHVSEHDLNVGKDVSHHSDGRSNGHVVEKEDGEVSGLRRRRGGRVSTDFEGTKAVPSLDSSASVASSQRDGPSENGHDVRRPEKKGAKQTKSRFTSAEKETVAMASVKSVNGLRRMSSESPSADELRAKELAESDRKVHESLDNLIRQTMGREPYMSFPSRTDRCLPRLHRPEVDPVLAGKISKGVKLDLGLDGRDAGAEDNAGSAADLESFRESSGSMKAGLGRGLPISDQLPGWPLMSPSPKVQMQRCQKCNREFCSVINYRRHTRTHKKIFDSDKEDWSKERPKISTFWDKLSPKDSLALLKMLTKEDADDYSGAKVVKSLSMFLQQASVYALPAGYQKAGAALLECVQNTSEECTLSADRLFSLLDDASEKTFLIGMTDPKDQKVFTGDEKIGLEDKNLVSLLGFLLEQKLMKAWMKDKDEEALKCQERLVAEEEAAQQKLAKTQEKKRMKKAKKGLKEKERRESALASPETESRVLENTGMVQGVGLAEDSPRSGPSSVGSSAEITELAGHIDRRDDEEVVPSHATSTTDEGIAGEVGASDLVAGPLQAGTNLEDSTPEAIEIPDLVSVVGTVNSEGRNLEDKAQAVPGEEGSCLGAVDQPVSGQVDLDIGSKAPRFEQERPAADHKRRESDKSFTDRKFSRPARPRTEYGDGLGSSGFANRPTRGTDTRYWETGQGVFKPIRKQNLGIGTTYSGRAESGTGMGPDSSQSRVQHFRTKSNGRSPTPTGSVQHGVWTVKASQPPAVEQKEKKDEDGTVDETSVAKTSSTEQKAGNDANTVTEQTPLALDVNEDKKELLVPDEMEVTVSEDHTTVPSAPATSTPFNLDGNPGDWPRLPQKCGIQGLTGEPSQPVTSVPPKDLSPAAAAGRVSAHGDGSVSHAMAKNETEDKMSGALLVGSLTVPLGNFGTDSSCPSNRGTILTDSLGRESSTGAGPAGANVQNDSIGGEALSTSEAEGLLENSDTTGYQRGVAGKSFFNANTTSKRLRPHAHAAGERGENSRHTGSVSVEEGHAGAQHVDVPEPSTGGLEELFRPRPLLLVDDSVREYVAMLSEYNRLKWEEAQNNPEAFRDMEAAAYVVEETDKVDFSEILRESEELWFKSNSQGQAQGEQALDDTPEATVQQDEPGQVLSATAGKGEE